MISVKQLALKQNKEKLRLQRFEDFYYQIRAELRHLSYGQDIPLSLTESDKYIHLRINIGCINMNDFKMFCKYGLTTIHTVKYEDNFDFALLGELIK